MNNILGQINLMKAQLLLLELEVKKLQSNPDLDELEKQFNVRTNYEVLVDPSQYDEGDLKFLVLHKSFPEVMALHAWREYDKELDINVIHYNLILEGKNYIIKNASVLRVGSSREEVWEGAKKSWLSYSPSHRKAFF